MRKVVLLAGIAALCALLAPGVASATFPGSNGLIAFEHTFSATNHDIFTVKPDGTDVKPLIATAADETNPAWSADGKQLAFARDGAIWTAGADGSNQQQIVAGPGNSSPTWSPDGTKIAFSNTPSSPGPQQIEVVDAAGGTPTTLRTGWSPSWSPDGQHIAFFDVVAQSPGTTQVGLLTMRTDGTDVTQWASGSKIQWVNVDWSPDGKRLAYNICCGTGGFSSFDIVDLTSGADSTVIDLGVPDASGIAWSPDGTQLAYQREQDFPGEIYTFLSVSDVDGTNARFLTDGPDFMPAWQALPSAPSGNGRPPAPPATPGPGATVTTTAASTGVEDLTQTAVTPTPTAAGTRRTLRVSVDRFTARLRGRTILARFRLNRRARVVVRVRDARGRLVARSKPRTLPGGRLVTVRLRLRHAPRGRLTVRLAFQP